MIALALFITLAQAAPAPAAPVVSPPALAVPPADWTTLPELSFRRGRPDTSTLSDYVRDEVRAGRCAVEGNSLRVDLAVLIATDGQVRRIRPRAIDCPTVEQYASGLLLRMARGNVAPPGAERWYRAALDFAWQ